MLQVGPMSESVEQESALTDWSLPGTGGLRRLFRARALDEAAETLHGISPTLADPVEREQYQEVGDLLQNAAKALYREYNA